MEEAHCQYLTDKFNTTIKRLINEYQPLMPLFESIIELKNNGTFIITAEEDAKLWRYYGIRQLLYPNNG